MPNADRSLRARLRDETRAAHEALDAFLSELDLTTPAGLGTFILAQHMPLAALEAVPARHADVAVRDLNARSKADLAVLRVWLPDAVPAVGFEPHMLATDYIVAGSRLGSAFLKKRWQATTDPVAQRANAYFTAPDYIDVWRAFCQEADKMQGDGAEADRIVADANSLFAFYSECAAVARTAGSHTV